MQRRSVFKTLCYHVDGVSAISLMSGHCNVVLSLVSLLSLNSKTMACYADIKKEFLLATIALCLL